MFDLLKDYWQQYLWGTPGHITGLAMTLWLTVISLLFGFIIAIPLSILRTQSNRWLSIPVWMFTYVFRGTPLYVQLLMIYSGIYSLEFIHGVPGVNTFFKDAVCCTLLSFTLNTAAYETEIFAGAIKATPYGEIEAAKAFGISSFNLYRRIILPSALRRALPMYSNEVILMLHCSTLASTATVPDILKIARDAYADYYLPFVAYGFAAILYLCVCFVLTWLFRKAERKWMAHLRPDFSSVKNRC